MEALEVSMRDAGPSPNAIRPERARIDIPAPAPKYGAESREILAGLGYGGAEIDAMIEAGVASESWCDVYLPE